MDISALLSPQDQPPNQPRRPAVDSPSKKRSRTGSLKDATLVQQAHIASAQSRAHNGSPKQSPPYAQTSYINHNNNYGSLNQRPNAPRSHSDPRGSASQFHPTSSPGSASRHQNSSMDTLADLATMQQYATRPNLNGSRGSELQSPRRSPSLSDLSYKLDGTMDETNGNITPTGSRNPSIVADHPMSDAPTPTLPPTSLAAPSLTRDDSSEIEALTKQIAENSFVHTHHVKLIDLLHQGLVKHISGDGSPESLRDPSTYKLVSELRQAREAMLSRFPVGEQLWIQWLEDECMLAKTAEERVEILGRCEKAVEEEMASPQLWLFYGHLMYYWYKKSFNISAILDDSPLENDGLVGTVLTSQQWSQEEVLTGQEIFKLDKVITVWNQAVQATQWNLSESHKIWNTRLEVLMYDLDFNPSAQAVDHIQKLFNERLRQPHCAWEETFQLLSQFISKHKSAAEYEQIMAFTTEKAGKAKNEMNLRVDREYQLQRHFDAGDYATAQEIMSEYLDWETQQERRKNSPHFSLDLLRALLERANLMLPSFVDFWEDHLDLIMKKKQLGHLLLPVIHRATRHCPWSGELWSRYLLILEANKRPYSEVQDIKNHATSTGLLEELGGMPELINVFTAWCGYLRRQAFRPGATEEDRDIAHVGILSALEDVKSSGQRKYGRDFKGDPLDRIERIYFKFLSQSGLIEDARAKYEHLVETHGDEYEFWDRYYLFEMTSWGKQFGRLASDPSDLLRPEHATRVLERAMRRPNLNWPEKIIEAYIHHCGQHESVEKLQEALMQARQASKQVARRRARERAEQEEFLQHQAEQLEARKQLEPLPTVEEEAINDHKRKRDGSAGLPTTESESKRSKAEGNFQQQESNGERHISADDELEPAHEQRKSTKEPPKRDRENSSVTISNLPDDCDEDKVRKFFKDCGNILSVTVSHPKDQLKASAIVEFESKEDIPTACTKDKKTIDDHTIEVRAGTQTTLWVTNFPPHKGEDFIRSLFQPYGEIVDVRFPSHKINSNRRFCYVQFVTSAQAQAATELDGKDLEKGKLIARISNPSIKTERTNNMEDGQEIHIRNLDHSINEKELSNIFKAYGDVKRIRILRNREGQSKGNAFLSFKSKEDATAALDQNLKLIKGRITYVSIARSSQSRHDRSAEPNSNRETPVAETAGSPNETSDIQESKPHNHKGAEHSASSHNESQSIALLRLPDTVTEPQIRAVVEKCGQFKSSYQITLHPEHQGAVVEFDDKSDLLLAMPGLSTMEIIPGERPNIGEIKDMLKIGPKKNIPVREGAAARIKPAVTHRPGQSARGRGPRGRIGPKPGLGFHKDDSKKASSEGDKMEVDTEAQERAPNRPKENMANDDFRRFLKKA